MRRPFSVHVFLLCTEGQNTFLLLKRRARPKLDLPAFWQGVSGALLAGESFLDAAKREVAEETGLTISTPIATGFKARFPIKPEWRRDYGPDPQYVEEHVFYAQISNIATVTLSKEHDEFAWCDEQCALGRLTFGQTPEELKSVLDVLRPQNP